jgi:hypothetical protein
VAEDIKAVLMVIIFILLIPWRYVFAQCVMRNKRSATQVVLAHSSGAVSVTSPLLEGPEQ